MDRRNNPNVTIIKRKKVVVGGHHGGAWKVAYADFVTAMMAFFLLLWLLSVTTEEQRMGLADYFSPTIPIHSTRGGGDGPFGGSSMFSQDTLAQDESGRRSDQSLVERAGETDQTFWEIEAELLGGSGEAMEADPLLKHIRTRVTDEGLIIEVFDIEGSSLFEGETARVMPAMERLVAMIGAVLRHTANPIAVTGHLAAPPTGPLPYDPWVLSAERAHATLTHLIAAGVTVGRMARVTGKADRSPAVAENPADYRNRRIEITLLRRFDP